MHASAKRIRPFVFVVCTPSCQSLLRTYPDEISLSILFPEKQHIPLAEAFLVLYTSGLQLGTTPLTPQAL
jgi:hypothetical protein